MPSRSGPEAAAQSSWPIAGTTATEEKAMQRWDRRIGFRVGAALVALVVQAAPAAAQGLAPGEYKVGFITENTGAIAQAGQSYWAGAQLAVEEVKSSKYLGASSIVLDPKESGSDAARAIQAVNQFIADRSIIATTCCILSPDRSSRSWPARRSRW